MKCLMSDVSQLTTSGLPKRIHFCGLKVKDFLQQAEGTFSHQHYFTSVPSSRFFSGSQQVFYFGSDNWLHRYKAQAKSLSAQLPRKPLLQSFTSEKVLSFAMRLSKLGNLQLQEKSRYNMSTVQGMFLKMWQPFTDLMTLLLATVCEQFDLLHISGLGQISSCCSHHLVPTSC